MKTALSIAGSDCSGGAGIQADLKTMTMNGVYAMSAIAALTAQNTTGVTDISEVSPEFLKEQIDAVFTDIRPDAVKTGMIPTAALIRVTAERLKFYDAQNIIVDPVMVATSGSRLMESPAVAVMKKELLPISTLVTPNIPEAAVLSGMEIKDKDDMEKAAAKIHSECGCAVLLKDGKRIANPNTHGTGCTLSSAIAANLAKGYDLKASVKLAKDYISEALAFMLDLGKGNGPMNHAFMLSGKYAAKSIGE